jgi:DNA polymerase-3 subunit alpha
MNGSVVFGLGAIKGIGSETINKIIKIKQRVNTFDNIIKTISLLATNGVGIKNVETLIKVGCFDSMLEEKSRKYYLVNLNEIFEKSKTLTTSGELLIKPRLIDVVVTPDDEQELINEQISLLGISFIKNPVEDIKLNYTHVPNLKNFTNLTNTGDVFHNIAKLIDLSIVKTKYGQEMCMGKFEDETQITKLALFPAVYEKYKDMLKRNKYYLLTIKASERGGQLLKITDINE